MSYEEKIKAALCYKYNCIQVPDSLRNKVLNHSLYENQTKPSVIKKLLVVCLIFALIIPTLGFGYVIFADLIYENYSNAAEYGITSSEYDRFNDKLSEASEILSPQEFGEFIAAAKDLIFFMIQYGDTSTNDRSRFGQVDVNKLTPEQRKEYEQLLQRIQPYFDKLNKNQG